MAKTDVTAQEWDELWDIIAGVRDNSPRAFGDADSGEIVDAIIAAGWVKK